MTIEITQAPTRRTKHGMAPSLINPAWTDGQTGDRGGWTAEILADGIRLMASRLDGEGAWTIDAAFRGSLPLWANGYGARYLLTKTLAAPLAAMLDQAIPCTGCGRPLDARHGDQD